MTQFAEAAIARGHRDHENLRTLLICTTSTATSDMVERYFAQHHDDKSLLNDLVSIALEGEDAGDAPWAAANVLSDFPVTLLREHEAELVELGKHDWSYLHEPARRALERMNREP